MTIIGSVVWTPQQPTAGQSVKIDVCGPDGKPYANQQADNIAINGVAGSQQYLQFALAGDQKVSVTALGTDGTQEQSSVTITVGAQALSPATQAILADPANQKLPAAQITWLKTVADINILTVAPLPPYNSPYHVAFNLLPLSRFVPWQAPPTRVPGAVAARPASAVVKPAAAANADEIIVHTVANPDPAALEKKPAAPNTAAATPPGTYDTYSWDFGDGTTETSDTPSTTHDFAHALGTEREFHQFHVTVKGTRTVVAAPPATVAVPERASITNLGSWTRTLSVHNTYVACKKQGYVVPTVTAEGWATKVGSNFVGTAVIDNKEPVPLTFVSRLLIPVLEDSDALAVPTALEAVEPPIVVPAHGRATVKVTVPFSLVPIDALGFSAVFTEQQVATTPVKPAGHAPAAGPGTVTIKSEVMTPRAKISPGAGTDTTTAEPVDPIAGLKTRATAHFLVHPEYRGKTAVPDGSIHVTNILDSSDGSKTAGTAAANSPASATSPIIHLGPGPDPIPPNEVMPPVAVGNQCDPDNLPEKIPDNFVCQVTQQSQKINTSARFLNARKGDVMLCPSVGAGSLIDDLYSHLTPPQLYGHCGIMTRNYEQITHCTASQSRIQAYTVGNWVNSQDEGFDPEALKYAWPGTLTQTVDHVVNGENIADPSGASYVFQDFLGTPNGVYIGSPFVIIPPRVVKPDPVLETTAVRQKLYDVADHAYANTGKFHYRFYCFTDPTASNVTTPASGLTGASSWANGTKGGVCTSFMWQMMKDKGVHALGPSQYATGDELTPYAKHDLQVKLDPNGRTPDGLFYYSLSQRAYCAVWLWNDIYNVAYSQAGCFGEALTGAAIMYADQLCNTFAADDSNTPNPLMPPQPYQSPGDANALGAEQFLAWNGPDKSGVLGYSEAGSYLPASVATVPIYKWASVTQYGKITGRVTLDGKAPPATATVQIPGKSAGTDKNGNYSFDHVAYGPYIVKAQVAVITGPMVDGVQTGAPTFVSGQVSVKVDKATVAAPDIKLKKPDEAYNRSVAITGYASLDCSVYTLFEGTSHATAYPKIAGWVDVGPGQPSYNWTQVENSNSATVSIFVNVYYNSDNSVGIFVLAELDDPGGRGIYAQFTLAPGKSGAFVIGNSDSFLNGRNGYYYNGCPDLEFDNDTFCCSLTITNNEWSG